MYDEFEVDILNEGDPSFSYEIVGGEGEEEADLDYRSSYELLGAAQVAVRRTIEKARDNRQPAAPLRAVAPDEEEGAAEADEIMADLCGGPGESEFPITTALMKKFGGESGPPCFVRMDTEDSYAAFRADGSPEMAAFLLRIVEVERKLADHLSDPRAHETPAPALEGAIREVNHLQAEAEAAEADKRIPLRMPKHMSGLIEAWHQDGLVGASMLLPRSDGGRWVVTCAEPAERGQYEAARAATEAGVPASLIVGYLPAIGLTLGASNAIKRLAGGAESILRRPEAQRRAPFAVRLEPKDSPALFALGTLARRCTQGDSMACEEWSRLQAQAPVPIRQAMSEIAARIKAAPAQVQVGGAGAKVRGFLDGLWAKMQRALFGEDVPALPPPAAPPKALPARAAA